MTQTSPLSEGTADAVPDAQAEQLAAEASRYLAAVDAFRAEGCDPFTATPKEADR